MVKSEIHAPRRLGCDLWTAWFAWNYAWGILKKRLQTSEASTFEQLFGGGGVCIEDEIFQHEGQFRDH